MLPKNRPPTHPGEMLFNEFLEPTGITQTELAHHLKWPYARLNEIIKGRRGITAASAIALGEDLGTGSGILDEPAKGLGFVAQFAPSPAPVSP